MQKIINRIHVRTFFYLREVKNGLTGQGLVSVSFKPTDEELD